MKIICISDTHGHHRELTEIPEGDMIIHAGDVSNIGRKNEVEDFLDWFSKLPFKHRIFINGNHDFFFDYDWKAETESGDERFNGTYAKIHPKKVVESTLAEFPGIVYLNDSGVEIDGIKIWGSPITPWFHDWAFNRYREGLDMRNSSVTEKGGIKKHWDLIPKNTDILVTHGPVDGVLDLTREGARTGCKDLLNKILETNVKIHICGHIHESYGTFETGDGRKFINASLLNRSYYLANKPIVFDFEKDKKSI